MLNPYTVRPVTTENYFVAARGGRGAQARRIHQNICRADPLPENISLVGERRFGKTSLLRYLQARTTDIPDLQVAYIDMLGLNPLNPIGFYAMLKEILSSASNPLVDPGIFGFHDFCAYLRKLYARGQRLVLLLDEFDLVVRDQHFDLSFFDNLRSAATNLPLALIIASVQPVARIAHQGVYGSPFFNIFHQERLCPLHAQEVQALITQPPGGGKGLDEALPEIIALAGHHPYFLQLACHCAWNLREEIRGDALDIARLHVTFQERARNQFEYIWQHCSNDEQRVLSTIAQEIPQERNEAISLIERGYILDEIPLRICGTGLQSFITTQCKALEATSDKEQKHMSKTIRILFLAANPKDTESLRLDEEIRSIDTSLRQAEFRDVFDIRQHWALRVTDLQGYLLRHQPDIVHFSGHGSPLSEIILEDNNGNSHPVSPRALSQVFSVLKDNVRCVVLNACYSEHQAQAIAQYIDCVVGMSKAIGDHAAVSFASAFYQALGYGRNIRTAFELGCAQIDLENLNEQDTPKLLAINSNPVDIAFVEKSL